MHSVRIARAQDVTQDCRHCVVDLEVLDVLLASRDTSSAKAARYSLKPGQTGR